MTYTKTLINTENIRKKRDMQNEIYKTADEMGIEEEHKKKLLLSYLTFEVLNQKMNAQKNDENSGSHPYGVDLQKRAIEDFVRKKTEENVTYADKNKGSQKSGKNANIGGSPRKKQKNAKKKAGQGGVMGKALAWTGGGFVAGGFFFT